MFSGFGGRFVDHVVFVQEATFGDAPSSEQNDRRGPSECGFMRRLLLYTAAIVLGGVAALLAWVWSEARVAFVTLGAALVGGLVWAAQRFPEPKRVHLLTAALVALLAGVAAAIAFPSTSEPCDCPPPPGTLGGYGCNCAIDHHIYLRVTVATAGAVLAALLVILANERRSQQRPA